MHEQLDIGGAENAHDLLTLAERIAGEDWDLIALETAMRELDHRRSDLIFSGEAKDRQTERRLNQQVVASLESSDRGRTSRTHLHVTGVQQFQTVGTLDDHLRASKNMSSGNELEAPVVKR